MQSSGKTYSSPTMWKIGALRGMHARTNAHGRQKGVFVCRASVSNIVFLAPIAPNRNSFPERPSDQPRVQGALFETISPDNISPNQVSWLEITWDKAGQRCIFIVDCQPLQRITCGHTLLLNAAYSPLFTRILDNLKDIFKARNTEGSDSSAALRGQAPSAC